MGECPKKSTINRSHYGLSQHFSMFFRKGMWAVRKDPSECRGRGLLNGNYNDFGKKKGKNFCASPKKNSFRRPCVEVIVQPIVQHVFYLHYFSIFSPLCSKPKRSFENYSEEHEKVKSNETQALELMRVIQSTVKKCFTTKKLWKCLHMPRGYILIFVWKRNDLY